MERLLSIAEAAALSGVSLDTLRRWERMGRLSAIRTAGGHRRYREEDVMSLVQPREIESRERAVVGDIARIPPSPSDQRMQLWNEAQRYILKATTTPVPWRRDDPIYLVLSRDALRDPVVFRWDARTSDECAQLCEARVRRRLVTGATMTDLSALIWQSIREYTEAETDRRIREENRSLGLSGEDERIG